MSRWCLRTRASAWPARPSARGSWRACPRGPASSCTSSRCARDAGSARSRTPAGVVERLLVHAGRMRVGPESSPVELGPGDYARYAADVAHVYEAVEPGASATLLMQTP